MLDKSRDMVVQVLEHGGAHPAEWSFCERESTRYIIQILLRADERRPMILPFMVKV